jgi:hypothetical protein
MVYWRLARYAGQDGRCFPAVGTLAQEIGVGDRQVQKCLAELEGAETRMSRGVYRVPNAQKYLPIFVNNARQLVAKPAFYEWPTTRPEGDMPLPRLARQLGS